MTRIYLLDHFNAQYLFCLSLAPDYCTSPGQGLHGEGMSSHHRAKRIYMVTPVCEVDNYS